MWWALDQSDADPGGRDSVHRFALGWVCVLAAGAVMAGVTWRHRRPSSTMARALVLGVTGIALTQLVASVVADDALPWYAIVPVIAVSAGLAQFPLTFDTATRTVMQIAAVLCGVSVLAWITGAQWATVGSRTFPAPWLNESLGGVLIRPNMLAPVASVGLALALTTAHRARIVLVVLFAGTLWLTDSRSQIATGALVVIIWSVHVWRQREDQRSILVLAGGLAAAIVVGGVLLTTVAHVPIDSNLFGLSGRPDHWHEAWEWWRSSTFIGVGPKAFPIGNTHLADSLGAYGAHNQVVQTMASDGLFGLVPLVYTLIAMVLIFLRARDHRRVVLRLVGVIGLAEIALETPLRLELAVLGFSTLFVSVFVTLCAATTSEPMTSVEPAAA